MHLEGKRCIHSFWFACPSAAEPETNRWKGAHVGIAAGLHQYGV